MTLRALIDAFEGRNAAIVDIREASDNPKFDSKDIVHMCLEGATVDIMVQITLDVYGPYPSKDDQGKSVLIVQLTKAIYGCVKSSMLFW